MLIALTSALTLSALWLCSAVKCAGEKKTKKLIILYRFKFEPDVMETSGVTGFETISFLPDHRPNMSSKEERSIGNIFGNVLIVVSDNAIILSWTS